jgi:hypothetical protein
MESGLTVLMTALPGQRITDPEKPEDGSILAYRKHGDEALFSSWDTENAKGMVWIPVTEFSPDPEAIQPPNLEQQEEPVEQPEDGTGAAERPITQGPFGRGGNLRRRPGVE